MKPRDMAARLGISEKSAKDWSVRLLADPIQPPNFYEGRRKDQGRKPATSLGACFF
jgi:hypothetical protein